MVLKQSLVKILKERQVQLKKQLWEQATIFYELLDSSRIQK